MKALQSAKPPQNNAYIEEYVHLAAKLVV